MLHDIGYVGDLIVLCVMLWPLWDSLVSVVKKDRLLELFFLFCRSGILLDRNAFRVLVLLSIVVLIVVFLYMT